VNSDRKKKLGSSLLLFILAYACRFGFTVPDARANGEIALVRAPDQIAAGDDVTIIVSASARETNIDRTVVLQYPATWKLKRAWRVEAGSDHAVKIAPYSEVSALFSKEAGTEVTALADYSNDFDPDAQGVAYFIVFSTQPNSGQQTESIKAALVERESADASSADRKSKRSKSVDRSWRMTFPPRYDFSFSAITTKRLVATLHLDYVPAMARSLALDGSMHSNATLHARPEDIRDYFRGPFSISFWFKSNAYDQPFLRLLASDGSGIECGLGLIGQPQIKRSGTVSQALAASPLICNDGIWHNCVVSKDSIGVLRLFIDAQSPVSAKIASSYFSDIIAIAIGDSSTNNKDFDLDELRFLRSSFREPSEFERNITVASRDTTAFAVFHFDDFGTIARPAAIVGAPMYFTLDSTAVFRETTSPVELVPVTLTAELLSPTKVDLRWQTTSELGIKQYRLERRIGTYGPFEKILAVDAKHGIRTPRRGQSIVSYSSYTASEQLPALNGDIELYYRLVLIGFSDKELPIYSLPVSVEYGSNRDVFLEQNDPNPFYAETKIAFRLTQQEVVRLSVFDMFGREVAVLENGKLDIGRHIYTLEAANWPPGIYFYKVKSPHVTVTRKMMLLR